MDYAQLKNLDTSKLATAAETAGSLSGSLSGRGGEVSGKADIPAGMWQGGDATAASSLMSPLSNPLYDVSDSASQSKGVLEDLVSALQSAKNRLGDAHDLAAGTGITIGSDGTVTTPDVEDEDKAQENERKARQIRNIIDEALEMANEADSTASGSLAGFGATLSESGGVVGETFQRMFGPATGGPMGQFAWGPWGVAQFGSLANIQKARNSVFKPRGANGRFISPANMSRAQLARAAASDRNFVAQRGQSATRANWAKWGNRVTKFGNVTSVATSGAQQVMSDWNRSDLSNTQKGTRAVYRAGVQGGAAIAGAKGGAALGAAVGSVVPGAGTAVGAAVGGIVGGAAGAFAGSELGGKFVDATVDTVGDAAESVKDGLGSAVDGAKDLASKIPTPW